MLDRYRRRNWPQWTYARRMPREPIPDTCKDCGAPSPPDEPGVRRVPCPECGSTRRIVQFRSDAVARPPTIATKSVVIQPAVERDAATPVTPTKPDATRVAEYNFAVLLDRTPEGGLIAQVLDQNTGELTPLGVCSTGDQDSLLLDLALLLGERIEPDDR